MFIAAFFRIAKKRKLLTCLLLGEWIKQLWYSHVMGILFSNEKEQTIHVTTYVDLQGVMLSE